MPEHAPGRTPVRVPTPTARDFDVIVVGAGPAGATAALVLARAGRSVCLLERGPFPGSKNMYGGVIYARVLDHLLPGWWEEAPIQRWVTRRATVLMTDHQALTVDYRTSAWGEVPYNGATAFRPDFDAWLASKAEAAGATLVCGTTALDLLVDDRGQVCGVRTDRPDGDLTARAVIACDGVNSFLAKQAGLYTHPEPEHFTLGAKEVLALPREEIEKRFVLTGDEGADFEIVGATQGIPGGGFVYTNLESIAVGVVVSLPELGRSGTRPEELIAGLKAHPMIAPLVDGAELKEYSAHVIPEGGYDTMPELVGDGIVVAGDAACMCLAAGIWLEGVNFAIGSGEAAAEAVDDALRAGDLTATGLAGYRTRLESTFVLKNHRKLRRAPHLVLGDRVQTRYPALACDLVEQLFTVTDPLPKKGATRAFLQGYKRAGLKARELAADAWAGLRTFG